jgi:LPS export ABC transporter protein LptC
MHVSVLHKKTIAALLLGCIFLSACENEKSVVDNYGKKKLGVEEVVNADITYTLSGRAKAKLLAPLMLRVQDTLPFVEFPNKLHVDFFDKDGKVESKLDALYGKYFESKSLVFLRDSVRVINTKGDTLHCKELYWDRARTGREFYTDKPVRIRTLTKIIDGTGMESAQDFKNWMITDSKGSVTVPRSQFPEN